MFDEKRVSLNANESSGSLKIFNSLTHLYIKVNEKNHTALAFFLALLNAKNLFQVVCFFECFEW